MRTFSALAAGGVALHIGHHQVFVGASHHMNHDASPLWDEHGGSSPDEVAATSVGNILRPVQPERIDYGAINALAFNANIQETSVFASDLIALNEQWQVMLGGRYIRFAARNHYAGAGAERKNAFVPTAALMWRPAPQWMVYVSHSRGLERGEYAPYNAANAYTSTDSIESKQVELGLKANRDENASLGLAIFDLRRDASYLNGNNYFVSDGKYRHRGVELSASARMARQWQLAGHVAFLDTALQQVDDAGTLGKRSAGAPRWKAAVQARYALAAVPGLSLQGTLSYTGRRAVDAQNSGFVPGYALLNASVDYATHMAARPLTLRLQARNLADKYYYAGVNSGGLQVGRGREIFLSATMDF